MQLSIRQDPRRQAEKDQKQLNLSTATNRPRYSRLRADLNSKQDHRAGPQDPAGYLQSIGLHGPGKRTSFTRTLHYITLQYRT